MSNPGPERHYLQLLLTARGIRAFGDGFVSILVPVYLTGLGIGAFEVGVLTTAMLLGPAMMTLTIGLIAHRLRRVTLLTGASMLMVLSGIGYAFETEFWPLLVIAAVGTLNPTASDVSVFAPLEQTLLSNAVLPERRTSIFASYSLIGSLLGAVGCLFASAPEILARIAPMAPNRALQGMFLAYAFLGALAFVIYRQLKSPEEVPASGPATGPLGPSRRIVFTLAALFSLDSFGGGFFVQSLLALWLFDHFGLSLTAAASLFFILLVWPSLGLFISGRCPASPPDRPCEYDGFHPPSVECLLDASSLCADARDRHSAAAHTKHPLPDGCAGAYIVCNGRCHPSRAPCSRKHHVGSSEHSRSSESNPSGLSSWTFELRLAAHNRRRAQ
jgi:MFS family permease